MFRISHSLSGFFLLEVITIIEFHEDENYKSAVDDATLRVVLLFFGQEAKDKLLYKDDAACSKSLNSFLKTGTSL